MLYYFHYQLAFFIPGINPEEAISLNWILLIPNCLMYPLGLPVILHLLCILVGFEFLGSLLKAT